MTQSTAHAAANASAAPARRRAAVLVASCLLAACWQDRGAEPPPPFAVARVFPELGPSAPPLLLNDAITVYFSQPVDPMTVSRDTLAVLDAGGRPVRGRLRVDAAWVTFEPEPPLQADLLDGSLRPGEAYRLQVIGYPRADGIRSASGQLLAQGLQRQFQAAPADAAMLGLPAPLRPVPDDRPFVLRIAETGPVPLPADDPRLQLHFTLPVLPATVTSAAFEISLSPRSSAGLGGVERIAPRAVRLLPRMPADEFAGATVEIEFGSHVQLGDGDRSTALQPDDFVGVRLAVGERALRDYAGRPPALQQVQWCYVVPGTAVTVAEWPGISDTEGCFDGDLATPGLALTPAGDLCPLVRVEAGDGSLGLLRPQRDLVLVPGEAFDRGDGVRVVDVDGTWAFSAIDIPAGVTVRVEPGRGPAVLLAQGRARIAGCIEVAAEREPLALRPGQVVDVSTLCAGAGLTVLAAGGIEVLGAIGAVGRDVPVALVTAGELALIGSVPAGTVLATERGGALVAPVADRCLAVRTRLQPGLPPGAVVRAAGFTPYRTLPRDRGAASMRVERSDERLTVAWQQLPPGATRRDQPDLDPTRAEPPREAVDGRRIDLPPGAFVRLWCEVVVRGGEPLPRLRSVRMFDR